MPAGLTEYVLASVSEKCPPFHITDDYVEPSIDVEYLEVDTIVAHQFVRRRGGKIAVLYETRWIGLASTSWEREVDLQRFRRAVLLYWAGKPVQRGNAGNQRYRDMRRSAASREIHRERGERFVTRGHLLVSRQQFERVFADGNKLLGAHLWFKSSDNLWWLGVIRSIGSADTPFVIRFLDNPGLRR